MEPIKVVHKIKLGVVTNLLLAGIGTGVAVDAVMHYKNWKETKRFRQIGEELKEIGKKMHEGVNKFNETNEEEVEEEA